jgi:response regulator RpfG family c-di-GMP phosphodiesterase
MSFAGYNILVIEESKADAQLFQAKLVQAGANVFVAHDNLQARALQQRWDIDIILCEITLLTGMSDIVVAPINAHSAKASPLLFVFGNRMSLHPQTILNRGAVRFFSKPIDFNELTSVISSYLFDPKKHVEQLTEENLFSQMVFILQDGQETNAIEVSEFFDDGLSSTFDSTKLKSDVASLTVLLPERTPARFAVQVDRRASSVNNLKLKVLIRDRERWAALIEQIDSRQKEILNFLMASSGR